MLGCFNDLSMLTSFLIFSESFLDKSLNTLIATVCLVYILTPLNTYEYTPSPFFYFNSYPLTILAFILFIILKLV